MTSKPTAPVQLKVVVPAELHRRVKVYAAETGTQIQQVVSDALTAYLKHKGAR